MRFSLSVLALSLSIGFAPVCLAQQASQIPVDARQAPGLIQRWNQAPTSTYQQKAPESERPPEPSVEAEMPPEPVAPEMTQVFQVNDITVQGVTKLSSSDVEKALAPYEGRELSFVDLKALAASLTELYHQKGYMTSLVYVPPQRIENGAVVLQASEGVLGEVAYEPVKYWPSRAVDPRISFEQGDVFNARTLKRQLRRINENPDFTLRAILEPGADPDQTNLTLEAAEAKMPVHVGLFYDNLGRSVIGTQRLGVSTTHNNLTGMGDQLFNTVGWTNSSFSTVTRYEVPLGPHGTKIGFDHAFSTLTLKDDFAALDITGKSHVYSGYISQELVNTDSMKIWTDLAFDFKRVTSYISDEPFFEDRLRVLRPGINFDLYDRFGRTMVRQELGIGLDLFDATAGNETGPVAASRVGAGSKFIRYTASATRLQRMPWNSFAIIRAMGQATPDRLVSIEQFQVGGAFTVRGYKEGRVIGDAGYILSGEWRVPFYLFPASWKIPKTDYVLRDNVQFVSFADFGAVFTNDAQPGVDRNDYVLGVGCGIRANLTRFLAARVDMGIPLLRQAPDNQDPRLHFGLESRLF